MNSNMYVRRIRVSVLQFFFLYSFFTFSFFLSFLMCLRFRRLLLVFFYYFIPFNSSFCHDFLFLQFEFEMKPIAPVLLAVFVDSISYSFHQNCSSFISKVCTHTHKCDCVWTDRFDNVRFAEFEYLTEFRRKRKKIW